MAWSRSWARFNRKYANPILLHVVKVSPRHGIVEHVGRRTGTPYQTPVLVFRTSTGFGMLPGYGGNSDWVLNILAAQGGGLRRLRRHYKLSEPQLLRGEDAYNAIPTKPLRRIARMNKWDGVLAVDASEG